MKLLKVVSIQRGCVYDGPGVRTTVFLKGCTLSCPWCCNPEARSTESDKYFIDNDKCLFYKGINSELCSQCVRRGGERNLTLCPFKVQLKTYREYTTESLIDLLLKDTSLYKTSNGGITFSGGEPLLYIEDLFPVLKRIKKENINVCVETTLTIPKIKLQLSLEYIYIYIIDVKLQPELNLLYNYKYLNHLNDCIQFLRSKDKQLIFRLVFVDSILLVKEIVLEILRRLEITELELLKCHNLGTHKYKKLGLENKDYSADSHKLDIFSVYLETNKIPNVKLSI